MWLPVTIACEINLLWTESSRSLETGVVTHVRKIYDARGSCWGANILATACPTGTCGLPTSSGSFEVRSVRVSLAMLRKVYDATGSCWGANILVTACPTGTLTSECVRVSDVPPPPFPLLSLSYTREYGQDYVKITEVGSNCDVHLVLANQVPMHLNFGFQQTVCCPI